MRTIRLLDLGAISPVRSQTVYHAVAYAMTDDTPDTILLVSPTAPYVCMGYHQNPEQEVDLAYCRDHGLPVIRREVGGGAVYLDGGQVFVQWVFGGSKPGTTRQTSRVRLPADLAERFALFARPLVETYRWLDIPAYFRPVNDIHVAGKKIGGTGAAQIGSAEVMVGSLMFTFDKAVMARVLKVASEKMRDKIHQSLEQYMTTIEEQKPGFCAPPGDAARRKAVVEQYVHRCAATLDAEIAPGVWSAAEEAMAAELDARFSSDEWLMAAVHHPAGDAQTSGHAHRRVKIHEDVRVVEAAHKTPGGLIRVVARVREGQVDDLSITGDFTILPALAVRKIEERLLGAPLARAEVISAIADVYQALGVQSPGVAPTDFAEALLAAV